MLSPVAAAFAHSFIGSGASAHDAAAVWPPVRCFLDANRCLDCDSAAGAGALVGALLGGEEPSAVFDLMGVDDADVRADWLALASHL